MRIHFLQHVAFEGLGSIQLWAEQKKISLTAVRLYADDPLSSLEDFDGLIVLGGPMGANDEAELHWLAGEKTLIRETIAAGKPVLGICLGAQLIASALGAKVYRNPGPEIGWFPIIRAPEASENLFGARFPETLEVFHWHGDTFDLPRGATLLASSVACKNQAYAIGTNVLALQFHLEMTPTAVRSIATACADELPTVATSSDFRQTKQQILDTNSHYEANNQLMETLLEGLFELRT